MRQYVYLSATPESLIASQLEPKEFGNYLATGTKKRIRGQAIFFEIDQEKMDSLPEDYIEEKLVPYKDGEPKRSVYLSIYNSLEKTPLAALKNLYLTTDDGKVLELKSAKYESVSKDEIHLYQQINHISTRVASKLFPWEFIKFLMSSEEMWERYKLLAIPPVRKSLEEKYIADDPVRNQRILDYITMGKGKAITPWTNIANTYLKQAYEEALTGKKSAEQALTDADTGLREELETFKLD